jgi:hypothetical protein
MSVGVLRCSGRNRDERSQDVTHAVKSQDVGARCFNSRKARPASPRGDIRGASCQALARVLLNSSRIELS